MNKFTSGEWMYSKYSGGDYSVHSQEGNGNDIALVRWQKNEEETLANVELMTASKELFEMLNKAVRNIHYPNDPQFHGWVQEAERLIYKITEDGL